MTGSADAGRLIVPAAGRNPVDIADDVARNILDGNDPPQLFSMSPSAVLLRDGSLIPLDADGWLLYVARRVTFVVPAANGPKAVAPPAAVMKLVPPVVTPELPPLDGIVATPYLDRDGNLVSDDGYHPGTRLVLHSGGFKIPPVSASPSPEDVAQAVKLLTEEWLADFPFASPADKANAIAVPLGMTGRMFFALAPLHVFDASVAGSGKNLLATTISMIVTGEPARVMELPANGEEQRKKITSALLSGRELIVWDESHVIAGRTLAAILTAEQYSDRLLGSNKLICVANRFTQVALGNNIEVWGDLKRRVVPSRLVPDTEHPEDRASFRHPNLEQWVRDHRGELLAALLTIWLNWAAKGKPEADAGMGSFERWARTVGGALLAAGIEGFRANTPGWLADADDDDDGWGDHLAELHARWPGQWFTVAEVAAVIETGGLPQPPVKRDPDKTLAQRLAYSYRKAREKWYGDLRLVRSAGRDSASGGRTWSVQRRSRTAPESSASSESSEAQVSGGPGAGQRLLTMPVHSGSSVDGRHGKTAGQRPITGDTDHPDHAGAVRERDEFTGEGEQGELWP